MKESKSNVEQEEGNTDKEILEINKWNRAKDVIVIRNRSNDSNDQS